MNSTFPIRIPSDKVAAQKTISGFSTSAWSVDGQTVKFSKRRDGAGFAVGKQLGAFSLVERVDLSTDDCA